jgi:hypothetical protein
MYKSTSLLFKDLTDAEEKSFREWARKNYEKYAPINGTWHPVCQDECKKINET